MDYQIFTFLSSFSWFYLTMLSNLYLTLPVNFYVCLFISYLFPIYFYQPLSICKVLIKFSLLSLLQSHTSCLVALTTALQGQELVTIILNCAVNKIFC